MSVLLENTPGARHLVMGNEAIARGILEAGVQVATAYPGTPSSEIIEVLSPIALQRHMYTEWSVNEKVALEVAAAASFAGLRSVAVMKQVGMNVAADFLLHLAFRGSRGGMVLVSCEDPGGLSSTNEGESRPYAKMMEFPLLEPGDFQEAKDMTRWAFELSERLGIIVMVRSVTRLSHASGNVIFDGLPSAPRSARFDFSGSLLDPVNGPMVNLPGPVTTLHNRQRLKMQKAAAEFETNDFNRYSGPEHPDLLIITASVCQLYCQEAIRLMALEKRIGLLKLGPTWPLPGQLIRHHLSSCDHILIVEEVLPFLEDNIEALAARSAGTVGASKHFYGKHDGTLPQVGELNPDLVVAALEKILDEPRPCVHTAYRDKAKTIFKKGAPPRELTFCPGCPHRASFWAIHNALCLDNRTGFVSGDIGCYSLGALPCGFESLKTLHAMGSGLGMASGFGKLGPFGFDQPIIAVCGDSTFYHAVMPALANALHNDANVVLVVLDNRGTAMTGFQAHPGLPVNAQGESVPIVEIPDVCRAMGAKVKVCDPFELEATQKTLLTMLADPVGVNVLVLRQICALSPEKKGKKRFEIKVDPDICIGQTCGCNQLCTRIFRCPGLSWDLHLKTACIDDVICAGCGVCADVCPSGAIQKNERV